MSAPRLLHPDGSPLFDLTSLDGASTDDSGGVLLRVLLHTDTEARHERFRTVEGVTMMGKRFRSELAEPVALTVRLDLHSLRWMAARACRSKAGRCKFGPVTVKGGKAAKFRRVDE